MCIKFVVASAEGKLKTLHIITKYKVREKNRMVATDMDKMGKRNVSRKTGRNLETFPC